MTQVHNVAVKDIINIVKEHDMHIINEIIYKDDIWTIAIYYEPSKSYLKFLVTCEYKNGNTGCTYVVLDDAYRIYQSDSSIKIRKDLVDKIESVARELNTKKLKESSICKITLEEAAAVIIRNYKNILYTNISSNKLINMAMQIIESTDTERNLWNTCTDKERHKDSWLISIGSEVSDRDIRIISVLASYIRTNNTKIEIQALEKIKTSILKQDMKLPELYDTISSNLKKSINVSSIQRFGNGEAIGYCARNKSEKELKFKTIDFNTGFVVEEVIVKPKEEFYVSKAELAILGASASINNMFSNGWFTPPLVECSKANWIKHFSYSYNEGVIAVAGENLIDLDMNTWSRFIDFNIYNAEEQLKELLILLFDGDNNLNEIITNTQSIIKNSKDIMHYRKYDSTPSVTSISSKVYRARKNKLLDTSTSVLDLFKR